METHKKSLSKINPRLSLLEIGGNIAIEKKKTWGIKLQKIKVSILPKKSLYIYGGGGNSEKGYRKVGRFLKCHKAEEKIKNS